jgi:hypothetical protein
MARASTALVKSMTITPSLSISIGDHELGEALDGRRQVGDHLGYPQLARGLRFARRHRAVECGQ